MANAMRTFAALPPAIMEFGMIFNEAGEELALVGGPVRDAFLGVTPHDFDITISTCLERTEEFLAQRGSAIWDVGKELGTIGGRRGDLIVKVTAYRTDECEIGSCKPEITFGDALEGGLTHRNFMISTMTARLPQMIPVNPCGGFADLADSNLYTPVFAKQSFDGDPLRIVRAVCSFVQLSLDVDMDVMNVMEIITLRLEIISVERIRAELERLTTSPYPRCGTELMVYTGVADIVLPGVTGLVSMMDEHKRHKDVYGHTLTVVEQVVDLEIGPDGIIPAPGFILHFTALIHNVGKSAARRFKPDGTVSLHHHEIIDAKMTRKRMKALHSDKTAIEATSSLVALRLRFHGYGEAIWFSSTARRRVADTGDLLERLHRLTCADCTTHNRRKANYLSIAYDGLKTCIAALREQEELDAVRSDLDGGQIMETLGLRPSRTVKIVHDYLLELRMERGPLSEEAARQAPLGWWVSDDVHALAKKYQAQQAHWEAKVAEKKARKTTAEAAREAQGQ